MKREMREQSTKCHGLPVLHGSMHALLFQFVLFVNVVVVVVKCVLGGQLVVSKSPLP